jgi:small subunit ribosomal protein S6
MALSPYEVVYIFDPTLDEEAINSKLTHFHSLVQVPGADAPTLNHWGKRTLAYQIKRRDTGHYVVANFNTEARTLPEFERAIKLDEGVLRHLVVLNDVPSTPANYSVAKAPDAEEEEATT